MHHLRLVICCYIILSMFVFIDMQKPSLEFSVIPEKFQIYSIV